MEAGGSERQLLYLLQGLDRTRFDVLLYLLYDTGSLLADVPEDVRRFSFWGQTQPPAFSWPGRVHAMQVRHLTQTLIREKVDVMYDRLFHMTLIGGPAGRRAGVPRVSTIVSPPQFDLERTEHKWRWLKRRRLARAYRESAALLAVAAGTADSAASYYGIPRHRFQVVPSPIDRARVESLTDRTQDMPPLRSDRAHLLAVGRLSPEKGHRALIDAVSLYLNRKRMHDKSSSNQPAIGTSEPVKETLPDIELHIAGDGPLRNELAEQASRLGIADHVHLHGHVNNPYAWMRASDLFCMPSRYEGMPNAMLEAMVCRVPVLATNTEQGPGELLRQHAVGQLVPVDDAQSMCEAIVDRFANADQWYERAQRAYAYVCEHHDLTVWLDRLSEQFHAVVQQAEISKQSQRHDPSKPVQSESP